MTTPNLSHAYQRLDELLKTAAGSNRAQVSSDLAHFLERFVELSATEQDEIRAVLTSNEARMIASLSVDAAVRALLERDSRWLTWALLAHDVEQFRDDPRNNLRVLAIIWDAARELGLEPQRLVNQTIQRLSKRSADYIQQFAARPDAQQSLAIMGIRRVHANGEIKFVFD